MTDASDGTAHVRLQQGTEPAREKLARSVASLLLGVIHAASFGPLDGWWLQPIVMAGLILLLHPAERSRNWRSDLATTWWFGLGSFVAGVGWMYVSMVRYGGMPAPIAAAAVVLLSLYLGAFGALAAAAVRRIATSARGLDGGLASLGTAMLFAACWTLAELARGVLFTGFPWLSIGYAHLGGPLRHFAPTIGVYGVGLFASLWAFGLALAFTALRRRRFPTAGLSLIAGPIVLALLLAGASFVQPGTQVLGVRLLQGNIPQNLKFDPERALATMDTYAQMVESGRADLTVLPETAWTVPWRSTPPEIAARLARHAAGGTALAIGMPLDATQNAQSGPQLANSVAVIGADGTITTRYDKRHLVPFGEFVPTLFGWFVRMMDIPLGDFARGETGQPALAIGVDRIAFNICFEDLFGEELAVQVRDGATMLVNLSNLAWFGDSHALDQHLRIARMRSLELGRPMLRATNTGVTAVIDHTGTIVARLPTGTAGVLEAQVNGTTGLTPYARLGNLPALALALTLAAVGAGLCARSRRRTR